jgi:uncharacterized membrane protein YeaQ/YmgE (transglycosylase-associated protein family)
MPEQVFRIFRAGIWSPQDRADLVGRYIVGLLSWILIGGIAGWVAHLLVGGRGGIIYDIVVGIVGALIGGFIMNRFGDAGVTGWNVRSFGVAIGGAVLLLLIIRLIRGRGRLGSSR